MGHTNEPKMDELKRLLRRLDGLDGKSLAKDVQQPEAEHREYVGALRGAPVPEDGDDEPAAPAMQPTQQKASNAGIYVAAVAAAVISTVTVYLVMSWQGGSEREAGPGPAAPAAVPNKLDFKAPAPGSGQRQSTDTPDGLLRRAEQHLQGGDIEAARSLLQQAAGLGSGAAALKLGRSYDPNQTETLRYADSRTNPALAKAWYERALALGTQEAAGYISAPGAR